MEEATFNLLGAFSLVTCSAVIVFGILIIYRKRGCNVSSVAQICLALFVTIYSLLVLEWVFRTQVEMSDGWHFTYASRKWVEKYWKPINSFGFRDIEHPVESFKGRKILFIVGDSFVTGHGIENIEDRFGNIIAKKLGASWKVVIIAKNAWNTKQEFRGIREFPVQPEHILLSYYINDIDEQVLTMQSTTKFVKAPEGFTSRIVNSSHLINFFYWRIRRQSLGEEYWDYLKDQYESTQIWSSHKNDLRDIINYAKQHNISFSVIIWPHLVKVEESAKITSKIAGIFREQRILAIDLGEHLTGSRHADLTVNSLDVHPNTRLHATVAKLWMNRFKMSHNRDD